MSELTEETVNAVIDMLPEDLDDAHLSALVLTIVETYAQTPVDGFAFLGSTLLTYARVKGISPDDLSLALSDFDECYQNRKQTAH